MAGEELRNQQQPDRAFPREELRETGM